MHCSCNTAQGSVVGKELTSLWAVEGVNAAAANSTSRSTAAAALDLDMAEGCWGKVRGCEEVSFAKNKAVVRANVVNGPRSGLADRFVDQNLAETADTWRDTWLVGRQLAKWRAHVQT